MNKLTFVDSALTAECADILSEPALAFVGDLASRFGPRVDELLAARIRRQERIDAGEMPDFLTETATIRADETWRVCDTPEDLRDRRVEITGPTDRKIIINALNSGANVFMADCEDSLSPTWSNVLRGQANLRDAVNGTIDFEDAGKAYRLREKTATLVVRPRGWHLAEKQLEVYGRPIPGALFDFGLFLFHNAAELSARGSGPYFYLPKLESHLEARLWADVFRHAEECGVVASGAIKITVLIETIVAAFEMDEILYELRDYIVGMNCGRWDYIFSFIKKFRGRYDFVLPDRADVTMTRHFLRNYSLLLIQTCHKRGAYAIGGMAAQIPVKDDAYANRQALSRVRADKEREVADGHDGTWVAHPALVAIAREVFDEHMPGLNQLERLREDVRVSGDDLLQVPPGKITRYGFGGNIEVALRYIAAWLSGNGCVPINNLMEDAATAEIARAQLWQWLHHATGVLDTGEPITPGFYQAMRDELVARLRDELGDAFETGRYPEAIRLLDDLVLKGEFVEFLTLPAYEIL